MNFLSIKTITITLAICILTACASSAKNMVLSPQVPQQKSAFYQNKTASLTVSDLRTNIHTIAIHKAGKATELISTDIHIDQIIKKVYQKGLIENSLEINENSANAINLIINTAQVDVQQELVKYSAKNQLTLTAQITSANKTLTKTYNNKGESEGAFKADIAVLERDFNQQLGGLLLQIINDKEIQQFIQ